MFKSTLKLLLVSTFLWGDSVLADFCGDQLNSCKQASASGGSYYLNICQLNYACCTASTTATNSSKQITVWPNCKDNASCAQPGCYTNTLVWAHIGDSFLQSNPSPTCTYGAWGSTILSCSFAAGTPASTLDVLPCSGIDIANCSGQLTCGSCSESLTEKESRKTTAPTKKK